jgi:hypothetical protein
MDEEEKALKEKELEEPRAYAEFLGQDPATETQVVTDVKDTSEDNPVKTGTEKPKGLAFYEIVYDHDNETYTMSKETFNHIRGI